MTLVALSRAMQTSDIVLISKLRIMWQHCGRSEWIPAETVCHEMIRNVKLLDSDRGCNSIQNLTYVLSPRLIGVREVASSNLAVPTTKKKEPR